MREQITINKGRIGNEIEGMGEPHLICALLVDTSGSMELHGAINSLNESIERFKQGLVNDPIARKRVEVALIEFNTNVNMINDFCPVSNMPTPQLTAYGFTSMGEGIKVAVDRVLERRKLHGALGTPQHKPWIFMITDGKSNSDVKVMREAEELIRQEEAKGHLNFWAIGVGDYDSSELFHLTKRVVELKSFDFTNIFDWLLESVSTISQSQVGETVAIQPLPEDARKADPERSIEQGWLS